MVVFLSLSLLLSKRKRGTPSLFGRWGRKARKEQFPIGPFGQQTQVPQDPVGDGHAAQGDGVGGGVDVEPVQVEDLLAGGDGAGAVGEALARGAGEADAAEAVAQEGADLPLDGGGVVDGAEEGVDVDAQHAGQVDGDGEDDGHDADGEARVAEHGEEQDAEALAARHDAKGAVGRQEELARRVGEVGGEDGEHGEQQAGDDLHGHLEREVVEVEGRQGVRLVPLRLVRVNVPLGRVHGDAVEHADEEHGAHGLDVPDPRLDGEVVVLERGEEGGEHDTQTHELRDAPGQEVRLAPEIDEAAV